MSKQTPRADLFEILAGIVADKENAAANLADLNAIVAYAEAGGESITYADAQRIQTAGQQWLHDQVDGNGEWSRMRGEAKRALED